jgi:hypothetical protein
VKVAALAVVLGGLVGLLGALASELAGLGISPLFVYFALGLATVAALLARRLTGRPRRPGIPAG